jgi:metallophosphoesterase (TIGR00282 family)
MSKNQIIKVLCIGDVFGDKGVRVVVNALSEYAKQVDCVVVNIENASQKSGRGISEYAYNTLKDCGVSMFTGGNHSFHNKYANHLYDYNDILRPCNYPAGALGKGHGLFYIGEIPIVVINVQLRVFMRELLSCPFRQVESVIALYKHYNPIFIIDVHGEATAEKISFAAYFDGKVSGIFGTHTHIQTSDERIFKGGTGYITDVGMVGSFYSSLGVKFERTIYNFIHQMPVSFDIEESNPYIFNACIFEIDQETKKCVKINRIADLISIE